MIKREIKVHFSPKLISKSDPNSQFNLSKRVSLISVFFSTNTHFKKPTLYHKIEAVSDPNESVTPILDQWINEGKTVRKPLLRSLVNLMKDYNRYNHALEISCWMGDYSRVKLTPSDVAVRLELVHRVYGLAHAEDYFENLSDEFKHYSVYCALLSAFVKDNSVAKAEAILQEMKEKGMTRSSFPYNMLMNLYIQNGDSQKIDLLIQEMEETGVIQGARAMSKAMAAYVSVCNISGMERILNQIEEDPQLGHDWRVYSAAASGYLKVVLIDKALTMLKKMENVMPLEKDASAFDSLINLYAKTGKKDELDLIWRTYKPYIELKETTFMCMISTLLKLDDILGADKIFREWESQCKVYDWRVLNMLLSAYCRKGLFRKAETAVKRAAKDKTPCASTWNVLAIGYIEHNQMSKAVEMLKKAVLVAGKDWRPNPITLTACLDYLEEQVDIQVMEEILKSLKKLVPLTKDEYSRLVRMYNAAGEAVTETEVIDKLKMDDIASAEETKQDFAS